MTFPALLLASVGLPFALAHRDPLIDGHGYIGDETMILSLALNGAMDGRQSYGTEPDGTPLWWPGWIPLVTVAYGPALAHADPVQRVELGRLVSRLLCLLGALAWASSALYVVRSGSASWSRARGLLLGLLASLMFLSFPPLVFIASFARNDGLGFLLTCLTGLAAVCFLRHSTNPLAAALLVFVAGAAFWGHFVSLLFSGYVAGIALLLAAVRARRDSGLARFCRSAGLGFVAGAGALCFVFVLVNGVGFFAGPTRGAQAGLLTHASGRFLTASAVDLVGAAARGFRKWFEWKEVPVAAAAVAAWAAGERLTRPRGMRPAVATQLPGPLVAALLQLPLLAALIGSLMTTYSVHGVNRTIIHDAYRPIVLAAYLSTILLALEIQLWSAAAKERAALVIVLAVALGLAVAAHGDGAGFVEWQGYRPFDHSFAANDRGRPGWQDELEHRAGNQVRQAHLRQLDAYLRQNRVAGLITLDPMLLLLRRKDLALYYFHFELPPAVRQPEADEEAEILRSTVVGRGVRLIAASRNGLDERTFSGRTQPLRELRSCIRDNWENASSFRCNVGNAVLSVELEWQTTGRRRQYVYGFDEATPVRLYRLTRVETTDSDAAAAAGRAMDRSGLASPTG